jgi:hypothetical protein
MNINPLWYVCLIVRFLLILVVRWVYKFNTYKHTKNIISLLLFIIGIGFLYKTITGSNDEYQVSKVFWHETRLVHAAFYLLASHYIFINNLNMTSIILFTDIVFSVMYRILLNK